MLLTSYEFIIFISICFVLYYILPKRFQWILLLVASYVFYFMAGTFYPLFLLATSLITYTTAILIEKRAKKEKAYIAQHKEELSREEKKAYKNRSAKAKRRIMLIGLLLCLGILAVFKYADFTIDNINFVLTAIGSDRELDYLDLLLPMGISFYTFQSLGYLLDVYWEKVQAQRNLPKYMLFVSFFPQLIQGPISRYSDLARTLYEQHTFNWKNVRFGLERILWGYFKKLVVADTILTAVSVIITDEYYNGAWVLVGIVFYGIELYADFTGGIDITIGVAQVFGIKVEENFIRPYFSKNIAEYWRRWHISMGTWFRDYIFYPMSISKSMNSLTKTCKKKFGKGVAKRVPVYLATMVTWFATGIWHGASWNFVMWGVMNGVVILISGELEPLYAKFRAAFPRLVKTRFYDGFQVIRTFLLMGSLRLFDCYRDVPLSFQMFFSMFRDFDLRALTWEEFSYLGLTWQQYLIVLVGTIIMFLVSMAGRKGSVREQLSAKPYIVKYAVFVILLFAVILFGSYGVGYDAAQFIYNQF
ncbi:MAG: MBOAT family protein [Lachnospiraceae bacterium]|nr:MBOAT family protein [Lachnospiraceae bacterium]